MDSEEEFSSDDDVSQNDDVGPAKTKRKLGIRDQARIQEEKAMMNLQKQISEFRERIDENHFKNLQRAFKKLADTPRNRRYANGLAGYALTE